MEENNGEEKEEKEKPIYIQKNKKSNSLKDPWKLSVFFLGAICIVLVAMLMVNGGITGNVIAEVDAADKLLEYAASKGVQADLVDVQDLGDFYQVTLGLDEGNLDLYVTKDGQYFTQSLVPLTITSGSTTTVEVYTEEDLEKISTFVDCLATNNVKIYGANWCGWTKKLVVDTLGGFDIAEPIYIECTEDQELCSAEGIEGYPTIKINGEVYKGGRTFESLSQETGCPAPDIEVTQTSTEEASC